jgi:heme exporter protein C
MCGVIVAAFLLPPIKDLKAHPVVYFHPPVAIVSFIAFLVAMVYGVGYLRGRQLDSDVKSAAAAEVGLLFCFLATVTGAMWSKANWGAYWTWDPKQTGIFVLLLIYGAYSALRPSIPDPDRRGALCAVYSIFGFVSAVMLMFVLPRMGDRSIHPNDAFSGGGSDPRVSLLFLASVLGFAALFTWIFQLSLRTAKLEIEDRLP